MRKPNVTVALLLCFSIVMTKAYNQLQKDMITPDEPMDGTESLISPSGYFRLGFFTPGSSKNRYLGLWYNNIPVQTVVWVANRVSPIMPEPFSNNIRGGALLRLDVNGTLLLTNQNGTVVYWYSERTSRSSRGSSTKRNISPPVARLLDNGNLQVVDTAASNRTLWQSFDYPSDTLLPGMRLGVDLSTGLIKRNTGWKSADDPAPGDFFTGMDIRGVPQIFLSGAGGRQLWRTGPTNGQWFSGIPEMKSYSKLEFTFVWDPSREVYMQYTTSDASIISRVVVNSSGVVQRLVWNWEGAWDTFWFAPEDQCDYLNTCGPYGVCAPDDAPICSCLKGFQPRTPQDWYLRDSSGGCVRTTPKDCTNGTDGFVVVRGAKLPDTSNATLVGRGSMGLDQCRAHCLSNCSCTAYAAADISVWPDRSGCIIWTTELTDLRLYANGGQDLYVRLAAKDLDSSSKDQSWKSVRLLVILVPVLAGAALLGGVGWARHKRNRRSKREIRRVTKQEYRNHNYNVNTDCGDGILKELDLQHFELSEVMVATDCFSDQNKLGKGGFGPVYKGTLEDGRDVAIKRLARNSLQGTDEFQNEVILIAKLQHRNLVRLFGCCIQEEERLLIYEYMSNGSLDAVLFDKEKGTSLDWNARYKIIMGTARGLLYLHQDSRLRIVHRDLKAGNVLLDKDLTPKISDFGMARIFGGDETEANTRRVVGTYGYMSPEYAMHGIFSTKSDVFSFGVLVLEIISGVRNRGVYGEPQQTLLGHVWSLWKAEAALELVDRSIGNSFSTFEVNKCIRIGLLCVQEHPEDRPTMSSVVSALGSVNPVLPQPQRPGFTIPREPFERDSASGNGEPDSVNEMTATMFHGR